MKLLPLPNVDDDFVLRCVIRRGPLATSNGIAAAQAAVRDRYASYIVARGNPCSLEAPQVETIPGDLQQALANRYDGSSREDDVDLAYIKEIRASSPNICPMCGSPSARTVDHIFPQSAFPELAIFSRNLVPACWDCNNHRRARYRGLNPTDRPLHPYFDTGIQGRLLVRATIEPVLESYRAPRFGLEPSIPEADPLFQVVQFHITHVIQKSGIFSSIRALWPQMQREASVFFPGIGETSAFTDDVFDTALQTSLTNYRREFGTDNNWKSMLLAGIQNNQTAKEWIMRTVRQYRSGVIRLDEI